MPAPSVRLSIHPSAHRSSSVVHTANNSFPVGPKDQETPTNTIFYN
jgi:hypothetical protein